MRKVVVLLVLVACSSGPALVTTTTGAREAATTSITTEPVTTTVLSTTSSPTWTYVAFGDSWSYGGHCGGCDPYPGLYAVGLEETTGHQVDFINRTQNGGTSGSLLDTIRKSQGYRENIAKADIIMINTGANDLQPAFAAWQAGTCGGEDDLDCFREIAEGWRLNFDAILTEIDTLRAGEPTAVRIVTNSNEFLADPGLIAIFGTDFGPNQGAIVTAMHHDILCEVANAHNAQCIDLRPVLNGPNFDQPQDINTQEAMQAVADALVESGLAELES